MHLTLRMSHQRSNTQHNALHGIPRARLQSESRWFAQQASDLRQWLTKLLSEKAVKGVVGSTRGNSLRIVVLVVVDY